MQLSIVLAEAAAQQPSQQAQHLAALEKAIREHCGKKLSAFKVCVCVQAYMCCICACMCVRLWQSALVLVSNGVKPSEQSTDHLPFLSINQVPSKVYFTDKLPKTATGKIQRRHMVTAFVTPAAGEALFVALQVNGIASEKAFYLQTRKCWQSELESRGLRSVSVMPSIHWLACLIQSVTSLLSFSQAAKENGLN